MNNGISAAIVGPSQWRGFMLDKVFSWPMIVAYFVVWNLWILLQMALEVDKAWIILNPLHLILAFNMIFGITYQIKSKRSDKMNDSHSEIKLPPF